MELQIGEVIRNIAETGETIGVYTVMGVRKTFNEGIIYEITPKVEDLKNG